MQPSISTRASGRLRPKTGRRGVPKLTRTPAVMKERLVWTRGPRDEAAARGATRRASARKRTSMTRVRPDQRVARRRRRGRSFELRIAAAEVVKPVGQVDNG